MEPPRLSILIACHQQGDLLPDCLHSVLAQRGAFEAIVVNDGSTDATSAVVRELQTRHAGKLHLIEQENRGLSAARQAGFSLARGKYILCLDADDLLEPGAVEAVISTLDAHPEAEAAVGNALRVAADGRTILSELAQTPGRGAPWPPRWPDVLRVNPFGAGMAVACRASAIRRVGGLEVPGVRRCEDWDLWVRMVRCGMHFVPIERVLGRYRQHAATLSRQPVGLARDKLALLEKAAAPDPRLHGLGLRPAGPISPALRAELANLHVAHSLGLLAGQLRADPAARTWPAQLEELLTLIHPDAWPAAAAAEYFLWGWQSGLAGGVRPPRPAQVRRRVLRPLVHRLGLAGPEAARRIDELTLPPSLARRIARRLARAWPDRGHGRGSLFKN